MLMNENITTIIDQTGKKIIIIFRTDPFPRPCLALALPVNHAYRTLSRGWGTVSRRRRRWRRPWVGSPAGRAGCTRCALGACGGSRGTGPGSHSATTTATVSSPGRSGAPVGGAGAALERHLGGAVLSSKGKGQPKKSWTAIESWIFYFMREIRKKSLILP